MADAQPRDTSRRGFSKGLIALCGAGVGALLAVPGVAYVLDPLLRNIPSLSGWRDIVAESAVRGPNPVAVPVIGERVDAWTKAPQQTLGTVWLRKKDDGHLVALSAECPHLGCRVGYDGEKQHFICPCHASAFGLDGKVVYGPSPRAMDELETRVKNDRVEVLFQRFQTQKKEKVEVG